VPGLLLLDQQHLQREVGLQDQFREADQLLEQVLDLASFGRLAALGQLLSSPTLLDDPLFLCDGVDQPQPVIRDQMPQLLPQCREVAGLDLDQQVAPYDVDPVAFERDLKLVAGLNNPLLERGVQGMRVRWSGRCGPSRWGQGTRSNGVVGSPRSSR